MRDWWCEFWDHSDWNVMSSTETHSNCEVRRDMRKLKSLVFISHHPIQTRHFTSGKDTEGPDSLKALRTLDKIIFLREKGNFLYVSSYAFYNVNPLDTHHIIQRSRSTTICIFLALNGSSMLQHFAYMPTTLITSKF